jgi:hypothetical protein
MSEYLCRNLRLSIERLDESCEVRLDLRNDISLEEVSLCYEINQKPDGSNRRYHLREAMVIAMRRLVDQAIEAGLISDCPGVFTNLKCEDTSTPSNPVMRSTIDAESL